MPEFLEGAAPRFETHQVKPGLEVHLRQDNRGKTHRLQVTWVGDLDDTAAARSLVPNCLLRGTQSDPSIVAISRKTEELWGAILTGDVRKSGESHLIQFTLEFVDDSFLPEGSKILSECTRFLAEVLNDPFLVDGKFPDEVVEQEKENQRRQIESLINNKRSYATFRCIQEACGDERFALHENGTIASLDEIEPRSLTDLWRTLSTTSPTHIHFNGNLGAGEVLEALEPILAVDQGEPSPMAPGAVPRLARDPREVTEGLKVQQANMVFCFRTGITHCSELLEPLVIANGILGVFAHSKLFLNVREAASLCYYAGSSLENSVGLLFINSGIDIDNRSLARELILQQVEDLKAGRFSDEDLLATQRAFDNRLRMQEDSPAAQMYVDLSWRLAGRSTDPNEYRNRLMQVTREKVIEAVENVDLDTIFLLGPEGEV